MNYSNDTYMPPTLTTANIVCPNCSFQLAINVDTCASDTFGVRCPHCDHQFEVRLQQQHQMMQDAEVTKYVATSEELPPPPQNFIESTARFVSNGISYGTDLVNGGISNTSWFVREKVLPEDKISDVKVPGVIKGTVRLGKNTTKFASKTTSAIVDGIVSVISYPFMPSKKQQQQQQQQNEQQKAPSYLSSLFHGVGEVVHTAFESKDRIVSTVKKETSTTVAKAFGDDAAQISSDAISTVNNCIDVVGDVSSLGKGLAKRAAKKAVTAHIKTWKKDSNGQLKEKMTTDTKVVNV